MPLYRTAHPDIVCCEVCDFWYVEGDSWDEIQHRERHTKTLSVLNPSPSSALKKLESKHGMFVEVNHKSPAWLHKRMFGIAQALSRENSYDFIMWDRKREYHKIGTLFVNECGHAMGAGAVRPNQMTKGEGYVYTLSWVWVAPKFRRKGLLKRYWDHVNWQYHNSVIPEPPFSENAEAFLRKYTNLLERDSRPAD